MAKLDLLNLVEDDIVGEIKGLKGIWYGKNNLGKSFQATKLPKSLIIMTESGVSNYKCKKVPVTTWSKFKEVVDSLTKESTLDDMLASYNWIVIDTAENLADLSERAVCNQFGVRDLSEIQGRQNGYKIARSDFNMQIQKLTSVGFNVLFIMHEETIEREDELTGDTYTYVQPKGTSNEKSSLRMLRDLSDICIYLKSNGVDKETYAVIPSTAICRETRNVFARARMDIDMFIEPFSSTNFLESVQKAIEKSAKNEGVALAKYTRKVDTYTKEDYFGIIEPYVKKLWGICQKDVVDILEMYLGTTKDGKARKITDATDDELIPLDNIYNDLVTKATLLGVEV